MTIHCFKADAEHWPRVKHFHKKHQLSQPLREDALWVIAENETWLGVARFVAIDDHQAWWLRGLLIQPQYRHQGLASRLLQQALTQHPHCTAFAMPHLDDFYQQLGFKAVSPAALADQLQTLFTTYQQQKPTLHVYQHTKPEA